MQPQPNAGGGAPSATTGSSSQGMTSPPAGSSTMGASNTKAGSSTMAQGGGQGQFMTQLQGSQVMASKLIGTTVVSANNESIGDVNDVIIDRDGRALAVVIGVGGFLGIGEKDVAVSFDSLEFAAGPATAGNSGDGNAVNTTGSTATGGDAASNRATATTGNTGSGDPNRNASASAQDGGAPNRLVLRMTKDQLQAAPTFKSDADDDEPANAGGGTGSTTSPRN
jgi:hypothetical protein